MKISLTKVQRIVLYVYFFSLNFQVFNFFGLGTPARLVGFLYLAVILPQVKRFFKVSYISGYLVKLFLLIFLIAVVSVFSASSYSYNVLHSAFLLNVIFFWFLINHERKDPGVLLKGFFSFALGSVFLAVLYKAGFGVEYVGGRVTIFGDNANAIALRMVISIMILAYFSVDKSFIVSDWRIFLLLPIPMLADFMLQTGSRKAVLALALSFVLYFLLFRARKLIYKFAGFGALLVVGLYFFEAVVSSEVLYKRLMSAAETGETGRSEIWANVMAIFNSSPVFGVGMTGYHEKYKMMTGVVMSPHNVLLEVLVYTGVVGIFLYLWFLLSASIQAYLSFRNRNFLLPLLLLIPVFSMILGGQALGGKVPWAIFALVVSTVFYTKRVICKPT